MKILITGAAGFIGHALIKALSATAEQLVGMDNLNDYYDVSLKEARLKDLESIENFTFIRADLVDGVAIDSVFSTYKFDCVVNLAAQAGVRYSLDNPMAYVQSNVVGFLNILEGCRNHNVKRLFYASSSSVYGLSKDVPFSTQQSVDHPISLYAATKKSNELMAHTYSHLYGIQTIGLRFFTVYGPWGRPDMAMFKFTKAILEGKPIDVYNHGQLSRDFTYIDDIISGILRLLQKPDLDACAVFNIGHGSPVNLMDFIHAVEAATGIEASCNYLPMQPGDVEQTWADTQGLFDAVGYTPNVPVQEGAAKFVDWYRSYYKI
ncbi:NAD-dependent epimerase/dehydratase family protein [Pseudomonas sp. SAR267]|uniref:NAD-dependent epimerase/dehydratase family protein n=1 Tax=unclassified Pseudomonas TaxID=196821 RepID=UPI0006D3EFC5|nr:NAD-dependent epimerase/dehydratase family protein [Pseudomonas sp. NBRC 111130]